MATGGRPSLSTKKMGTAPRSVTFYRVPYDVKQTQDRIFAAALPERLALRLATGR